MFIKEFFNYTILVKKEGKFTVLFIFNDFSSKEFTSYKRLNLPVNLIKYKNRFYKVIFNNIETSQPTFLKFIKSICVFSHIKINFIDKSNWRQSNACIKSNWLQINILFLHDLILWFYFLLAFVPTSQMQFVPVYIVKYRVQTYFIKSIRVSCMKLKISITTEHIWYHKCKLKGK